MLCNVVVFRNTKEKKKKEITCSLSRSWLEVWSDCSPSVLLRSSVTLCSSSLRLSSTSDNVYKGQNKFSEKLFVEAYVSVFFILVYLQLVRNILPTVWKQVCLPFPPSSPATDVYFQSGL